MIEAESAQLRLDNTPRRLEKAMHILDSILQGMTMDRRLCGQELLVRGGWIREHHKFRNKHPFSEVMPRIVQVVVDQDCGAAANVLLCPQAEAGAEVLQEVVET